MKKTALLFFLLLPFLSQAQRFIGKSREKTEMILREESAKQKIGVNLVINDTMISYQVKDDRYAPAEFMFHFNRKGKCNYEKVSATCDSCFHKYFDKVLSTKQFGWKQINANQYISKYSKHLLLEVDPGQNQFAYRIIQTGWNRTSYKLLSN